MSITDSITELNADAGDIPAAITVYPPGLSRYGLTPEGLEEWRRSPLFSQVLELARNHMTDSLISDESRALLYHLILTARPQRVLEIGTYRAGTSHFIAQALHHAGRGVLYTIDPFGNANGCPQTISSWPAHLRQHVRFFAVDSALFFDHAINRGMTFDLVFIDGNHELEFATFDLNCSARLITPGGIVILDNIDQPGPRYAAKLFSSANPDWQELGKAVSLIDDTNPFASLEGSFANTKFFILQAPSHMLVSSIPRSFGSIQVPTGVVDAIELEVAGPASGTLHFQVFCRAFGERVPEELTTTEATPINVSEAGRVKVPLQKPLAFAPIDEKTIYRTEIILAFIPTTEGFELHLHGPPTAAGHRDRDPGHRMMAAQRPQADDINGR